MMDREFVDINPRTEEEFLEVIRKELEGPFDYETSADALWRCALAAFNYAANVVGPTGFQAGWAALTLLGQINHIEGPYGIVDGSHLVYPQYDLRAQVDGWLENWTETWAKDKAKELLQTADRQFVSPRVLQHWENLANS